MTDRIPVTLLTGYGFEHANIILVELSNFHVDHRSPLFRGKFCEEFPLCNNDGSELKTDIYRPSTRVIRPGCAGGCLRPPGSSSPIASLSGFDESATGTGTGCLPGRPNRSGNNSP